MLHVHDILDQQIILSGKFVPSLKFDEITDAINEIVQIVRYISLNKSLKFKVDFKFNKDLLISFDRRRL